MLVFAALQVGLTIFAIALFVAGYEYGHHDGMRCDCEPNQPWWRKWLNRQRIRPLSQ